MKMHLKAQLQLEKLRPTLQRSNVNQHLVGGYVLSVRLAPEGDLSIGIWPTIRTPRRRRPELSVQSYRLGH
jgi:hypothetical protein